MKKSFVILFIIICIVSFKSNAQYITCSCNVSPMGTTAILNLKGVAYPNTSPFATITTTSIEALFGTNNYTGDISATTTNSVCVGQPATPGGPSPCAFPRPIDNFNIKNSTTAPAGIDYSGSLMVPGVTARVTLPVGVSILTVYIKCKAISNGTDPNGGIETKCEAGIFSINVLPSPPPFAVNITNQCHTTIPQGQTAAVNSGNYKFKINFSSPPPQGAIVMLLKNNVMVEQRPASQFNLNTDYFFENSTTGYGNGIYKVKILYNNAEIFATNLPLGYAYSITRRNLNCVGVKPKDPTMNATPITLP